MLEPLADFPRINLRAGVEPWDKRRAAGKALRWRSRTPPMPPSRPAGTGPTPVSLIEAAHEGRQAHLLPLRVARMASSPFAFLRGAAQVMAWDLAQGPRTAINVVMNGDAHIPISACSARRRRRGARSQRFRRGHGRPLGVGPEAALRQHRGRGARRRPPLAERREAVVSAVSGYQFTMDDLAPCGSLDVWRRASRPTISPSRASRSMPARRPSWRRPSRRRGGRTTRASSTGWASGARTGAGASARSRRSSSASMRRPARPSRRAWSATPKPCPRAALHAQPLSGGGCGAPGRRVGSVGTRAYVALLFGNSDQDALFLQVKEPCARPMRPTCAACPSPMPPRGRAGDLRAAPPAGGGRPAARVDLDRGAAVLRAADEEHEGRDPDRPDDGAIPALLLPRLRGLLAKAHARTGDAAAIAGYCGHTGRIDLREAIAAGRPSTGTGTPRLPNLPRCHRGGRLAAADDPVL